MEDHFLIYVKVDKEHLRLVKPKFKETTKDDINGKSRYTKFFKPY